MPERKETQTQNANQRKKTGGFANVAVLILLPTLAIVFFAVAELSLVSREHTRTQSVCKSQLFNTQDQVAEKLNKLIALNPKARQLRIQMRKAKIKLLSAIASGNELAITAAERRITEIELKQFALDQEQKRLITEANLAASSGQVRAQQAMGRVASTRVDIKSLKVVADQPQELAPIYRAPASIRSNQRAYARYKWELPAWLQLKWLKKVQPFSLRCVVSIEQRGSLYRATLIEEGRI